MGIPAMLLSIQYLFVAAVFQGLIGNKANPDGGNLLLLLIRTRAAE